MGKKSPVMKFNYDVYRGKLTCINEKQDTILIQGDLAVKYAYIGMDTYYHDVQKGYFKILRSDTAHVLASLVELQKHPPMKVANEGYGGNTNGTSASVRVTLSNQQDEVFERVTTYFLIDERGLITKANKSGFFNMFSKAEKGIKSYMKEQKIDFAQEEDILKLFSYCLTLL